MRDPVKKLWILLLGGLALCGSGLGLAVALRGGRSNHSENDRLQSRSVDPGRSCGPVSLAVVGRWLGKPESVDRLNNLCRVTPSGVTSLLDLKRASTQLGLYAEVVKTDTHRGLPWSYPTILHLHGRHFAAALPTKTHGAIIADLPEPTRFVKAEHLEREGWDGYCLVVSSGRLTFPQ